MQQIRIVCRHVAGPEPNPDEGDAASGARRRHAPAHRVRPARALQRDASPAKRSRLAGCPEQGHPGHGTAHQRGQTTRLRAQPSGGDYPSVGTPPPS